MPSKACVDSTPSLGTRYHTVSGFAMDKWYLTGLLIYIICCLSKTNQLISKGELF